MDHGERASASLGGHTEARRVIDLGVKHCGFGTKALPDLGSDAGERAARNG